jgi:hypothetical protein
MIARHDDDAIPITTNKPIGQLAQKIKGFVILCGNLKVSVGCTGAYALNDISTDYDQIRRPYGRSFL